jgi:hypothetical protein
VPLPLAVADRHAVDRLVQRHVHFVLLLCLGSARVRAKLKLEIYQTIST